MKYRNYILAIIAITGFVLRTSFAGHEFWLDEITTTWVINDGFSGIFERCWINNLSPLYYLIIYLSKELFGYTEVALRIPGILAVFHP